MYSAVSRKSHDIGGCNLVGLGECGRLPLVNVLVMGLARFPPTFINTYQFCGSHIICSHTTTSGGCTTFADCAEKSEVGVFALISTFLISSRVFIE